MAAEGKNQVDGSGKAMKGDFRKAERKSLLKEDNENARTMGEDSKNESDSEGPDFKDENYDIFNDEELDDGSYDLTVDFEYEHGFRFKKKSENESRKKYNSNNLEDEQDGQCDNGSDSDSDKNNYETHYASSDTLLSCCKLDENEPMFRKLPTRPWIQDWHEVLFKR